MVRVRLLLDRDFTRSLYNAQPMNRPRQAVQIRDERKSWKWIVEVVTSNTGRDRTKEVVVKALGTTVYRSALSISSIRNWKNPRPHQRDDL